MKIRSRERWLLELRYTGGSSHYATKREAESEVEKRAKKLLEGPGNIQKKLLHYRLYKERYRIRKVTVYNLQ